MNERVRELRELLNLSQHEFAKSLGLKQSSISDVERGKVRVGEATIKLICLNFGANSDWIKNGTGSPFEKHSYRHRTDLTEFEKGILDRLNMLDAADKSIVENMINVFYEKRERLNSTL
ncbi:hypothetical protein AGMMS49975_28480 [Clostridia bacterium]|nr:hypothetical protein AGMMS49975_28480 [Clostridia bacterium]